jgi:N-carbamoyl-L-amino-acid hydrolase
VSASAIDAERVIADLRELDRRTGGSDGAQRVAWTEGWRSARSFVGELLGELGIEPDQDAAGNLWARLPGRQPEPGLGLGSHLDSVPGGGWLDGALGVMTAVGVLRAFVQSGRTPARTLWLIDWADEEGAAFGHSLFGSSAFAGMLDLAAVSLLRDREGTPIAEVLAQWDVDLQGALAAGARRDRLRGYLELHIEQGPRLESEGLPVAAVSGCVGVERHRLLFSGAAAHAGSTPMELRHDAGLSAMETALAVERIARSAGGVATVGSLSLQPGIATAVPGQAELLLDLRHADAAELASMLAASLSAARGSAEERGCEMRSELVWSAPGTAFDAHLVDCARAACRTIAGTERTLPSGALHDAVAVASVLPVAMIFSASIGGVSHERGEDTSEADLVAAIRTFALLVERTLDD